MGALPDLVWYMAIDVICGKKNIPPHIPPQRTPQTRSKIDNSPKINVNDKRCMSMTRQAQNSRRERALGR